MMKRNQLNTVISYYYWTEIISFLSSSKDFFSLMKTIKGLQYNIQSRNQHCAKNVVFRAKFIPYPQKITYVKILQLGRKKGGKDKTKEHKFFNNLLRTRQYKKNDRKSFRNLFERMFRLCQSTFPNLRDLRLRITHYHEHKYDSSNFGNDFSRRSYKSGSTPPWRDNIVMTTKGFEKLTNLSLCVSNLRKFDIEGKLPCLSTLELITIGSIVKTAGYGTYQGLLDSTFLVKFDLRPSQIPKLRVLRLHGFKIHTKVLKALDENGLTSLYLNNCNFESPSTKTKIRMLMLTESESRFPAMKNLKTLYFGRRNNVLSFSGEFSSLLTLEFNKRGFITEFPDDDEYGFEEDPQPFLRHPFEREKTAVNGFRVLCDEFLGSNFPKLREFRTSGSFEKKDVKSERTYWENRYDYGDDGDQDDNTFFFSDLKCLEVIEMDDLMEDFLVMLVNLPVIKSYSADGGGIMDDDV